MLYFAVAVATLLPMVSYLAVGFSRNSKATSPEEYFIYGQSVTADDYANTSVGYALQMAAIFLFAYWGVLYGLGGLWVCLFWMGGFLLLYFLIPRFQKFHQAKTTLHGYLGTVFSSRKLQVCAAICSIIGLWGTMMAEIDYTTIVYSPVIGNWPKSSAWFLQAFFLLFGAGYIIFNGYKAEVNTERFQVPIAYCGLLAVLLFTITNVQEHAGASVFRIVCLLLACSLLLIILGKLLTGRRSVVGLAVPLLALIILGFRFYLTSTSEPVLVASGTPIALTRPMLQQFNAQGAVALVSLFLANVFWLPVDISTWQRIASVEGKDSSALIKVLQRGTLRVAFESPATWILGVVLGLIMAHGGYLKPGEEDSCLLLFSTKLLGADPENATSATSLLLYSLFIMACVSIMLSTVNSLVSAIGYTLYRDVLWVQDSAKNTLRGPRIATALIVILGGLIFYPVLTSYFGARLQTFLYAAYAAQLSLLFVVVAALFQVRLAPRAAIGSVIGGLLGTVLCFVLVVYYPQSLPSTDVLPPSFAIIGAFFGLILFTKRPPARPFPVGKET